MPTLPFPDWMLPDDYLNETQAKEYMAAYAPVLSGLWSVAWERYRRLPLDVRTDLRNVTRSGIVRDFMVVSARKEFAHSRWQDRVALCDELGFFKIYLGDKVVVRLKRLD